jgi:hypothetical protein
MELIFYRDNIKKHDKYMKISAISAEVKEESCFSPFCVAITEYHRLSDLQTTDTFFTHTCVD